MLSEEQVKRPYQDAFPRIEPTVSNKTVHLNTIEQGSNEYLSKPVSRWSSDDVVNFLIDTHRQNDYNFSVMNGIDGPQLVRQTREFFISFSAEYGEDLYNEVQRRVLQERATSNTSTHYPASLSSTTTTTTSPSVLQRPFFLTASPHSLHHLTPQPSVICDAQARYELVIEPPAESARFPRDQGSHSIYNRTPAAALKSAPPPLVALDRREERQEGVREREAGRSGASGGEQSQVIKEEVVVEPPKKRGPGRPKKPESELKKKKKKTGRLWEFIRNLLLNPDTCPSLVKWENPEEGLFRFIDGEKVAKRWGERKGNTEMNYEKLSRAMRYYYKTHIFEAVIGRRLVYKFGKKASGWRTSNPNFVNPPENPSLQEPPPAPPQPQPPPPPPHHRHHYNEQLRTDIKPETSQGDLVLSPPHHHLHLHHYTDAQLLMPDMKAKINSVDMMSSPPVPPPAHHFKEEYLSSPHTQDTKSHHHHPLSLTLHHTPHLHHHT